MTDSSPEFERLFTVEQANAMLPLVRAICSDMSQLAREVVERRERIAMLTAGRRQDRSDLYSDELAQIDEELGKDAEQLDGYLQELRELGIEPKNALEGLVDFPSLLEGRIVYLCWKLDEPEVLYWHDIDAGFSGRQPLTAASRVGDDEFSLDSDSSD